LMLEKQEMYAVWGVRGGRRGSRVALGGRLVGVWWLEQQETTTRGKGLAMRLS